MAYQDVILADGPSGYWPLQETSGLVAANLVAGPTGTITGGVTLGVPGPAGGRAMRFNGTSGQVTVAKGSYSDFGTGPLTLECWVRLPSPLASSARVMSCSSGTNPGVDLAQTSAGVLNFVCRDATVSQLHAVNGVIPATGQWCHLAIPLVRGTPDTVQYYVNGVAFGSLKSFTTSGVNFTGTQLLAMAANPINGSFFAGDFAQIAVYKVALTPAQIRAHYRAAFATVGQGGMRVSGTVASSRSRAVIGAGGLHASGVGLTTRRTTTQATGGATITGLAASARVTTAWPTGGVQLSGAARIRTFVEALVVTERGTVDRQMMVTGQASMSRVVAGQASMSRVVTGIGEV